MQEACSTNVPTSVCWQRAACVLSMTGQLAFLPCLPSATCRLHLVSQCSVAGRSCSSVSNLSALPPRPISYASQVPPRAPQRRRLHCGWPLHGLPRQRGAALAAAAADAHGPSAAHRLAAGHGLIGVPTVASAAPARPVGHRSCFSVNGTRGSRGQRIRVSTSLRTIALATVPFCSVLCMLINRVV